MCLDVFSIFDLYEFNSMMINKQILYTLLLVLPLIIFVSAVPMVWTKKFSCFEGMSTLMSIINTQCSRTGSRMLKGYSIVIVSLFLMLISVNLFGLISFSLSLSSHLVFSLLVGLPLWMSVLLSSFVYKYKVFIAHLLPDGAPLWLNPFLVLIESVSIMVRPVTLSFRLAANMTAGHVVLCLMTSYLCVFLNCLSLSHLVLLIVSSLYVVFEVGICVIQSYIFCLLLSLYSDDHS
nr:ATP synthase F0 subunit 6 [Hirudo nipponia]WDA96078.1 ATP synthase F0 subunit 6 [Hirudo nipponia]